jgi:hypothetical protein
MNTVTKLMLVFSVSAIGSSSLAVAKNATAGNYRHMPSSACNLQWKSGDSSMVAGFYGDWENYGEAQSEIDFVCPVIDDQAMPAKNITTLWVDTYQGNASLFGPSAAACTVDWWDTGGKCGAPASLNTANSHVGLKVDTSAWTSGAGFYPNIQIAIPGGRSAFLGYNMSY